MKASKFLVTLWLVLLLTLGLTVYPLLAAGSTFDFNALTLGPLDGQDGWSTVTYNHTEVVQVVDGTTTGIDGTPYLQFNAGGGGVGADGWRLNAFTPFNGTESYAYVQADVSANVSWGVTFGLGYDTDGDGVRKTESSDLGVRLTATWGDSNNVYLDLPGGMQHVGTATRGTYTWCSYRLVMDFAANNGQGSGSAFYSLDAGATWQPVTGLQDVNLGLDPTATDAANPTLWDDLFFHFEGQISELDNFTIGTLDALHLPLDEGAGATTFVDASGNDNHGTCAGDSCPTAGVSGMDGTALSFDGIDDYVEVPYDASLNPESFTVMAWAKVMGGAGTYRSVVTSRGNGYGYLIYATAANEWQFWMGHGSGWEYLGSTPVIEGEWTHLAAVYDSDSRLMQFYVNKEAAGSLSNRILSPNPQWPLRVGAGTTEEAAQYFFHGEIDDVRVYNQALSQSEIQALVPDVPTCFVETTADNVTDYSSVDASAVQAAIDNASPGALLKVAGTCAGVQSHSGTTQVAYVGQSVTLQGGYTRTNWLAPSDPATYVTTLDAENNGRVLYVPAGTTAILDGLTLTRGYGSNGGGIYNAGTLTLTHSIVHDNEATTYGGGMYNAGTSPTLTDVTFSYNSSSNYGGGMYNYGSSGNSSPTLTRVTFNNNSTSTRGGGMFNYGGGGISAPTMTDVVFRDNSAGVGGAIHFFGDNGDLSATITNGLFDTNGTSHISYDDGDAGTQPHFVNCTFYGATSEVVRITYFDSGQTPIDFTNAIFWSNNGDLTNNDAALNVQYAIVEESGYPGTANLYADPHFTDAAHDNFVPQYYSRAIDFGDDGVCPTTDLRGNLRDDWGCDAGAYEVQLSDTTMINRGVTGAGTYTFGPTQARIQVHDAGGCLNGLEVQRVAGNHINATTPLQTGAYWIITPGGCTSGFDVTLTLPFAAANSSSRLCRWLEGVGTGYGWDCGDGTHTTFDDVNGWVIRSNVTGFSDWAVGNDVGPTAVTLVGLGARSAARWLPALGLLALAGWVLARQRAQIRNTRYAIRR